ncbi:hypothetical protein OBBRIDRAFT_883294 [Obba rivulosa]|uniref:Uncharacterized protein n=1 Tax=Obba rivulosa TaxID=1052685 RepID=A0A8E2DV20_9APHY|nr:hypothetical protein OBBRIDRAFT_883294 [Obba rivulosa]
MAPISISNQTMSDISGFVPGPSGRGTLDIFWSCASVLILCTWTVVHIDVEINWLFIKLCHATGAIFAPDVMLAEYIEDFVAVKCAVALYNECMEEHQCAKWTMVEGFYAKMDGFTLDGERTLGVGDIITLVREGFIDPQPSYNKSIRDRSKADSLSKFIACGQALWLIVQGIARTIEHLPISTLELGTIGYVFVACAMYAVNWHKPKDVRTTISIPLLHGESYDDAIKALEGAVYPVSIKWSPWRDKDIVGSVVACGACIAFGAWHCTAWSNFFPSHIEQELWRICAVLSTFPSLLVAIGNAQSTSSGSYVDLGLSETARNRLSHLLYAFAAILYMFARGFLFVEMFIGLRRMPVGVFTTIQWTELIPHI